VLIAVAFGYFVICFSLSQVGRYLERRTTRELRSATEPRKVAKGANRKTPRLQAAGDRSGAVT
jgi:hypothetical protein